MGLRLYLFGLYSVAVLSVGLATLLVFNVDPFSAPTWIIILTYALLFLFLTCLFGIIGFYLKVKLSNREVIFANLGPALRQSALFAFLMVGLIFLLQVKSLNWWIGILFVIAILMLELFFRSKK